MLADRLGIRTISVESDPFYAKAVRHGLSERSSVTFITPKMGLTKEWGWPIFNAQVKGERYVNAPFETQQRGVPDFVLIDGRYRVACALSAARRAYEGSITAVIMVDDYLERPHYHVLNQILGAEELAGRSAIFKVGRQSVPQSAVDRFVSDPR